MLNARWTSCFSKAMIDFLEAQNYLRLYWPDNSDLSVFTRLIGYE